MSMNPSSLAPWVKSVPRGWTVKRLKYTVKLINEKVDPVESDLPYMGLENIESWTGRRIQPQTEPQTAEGLSNYFRVNDVLFGKLRPYLAKVYRAEENGLCSGEMLVLRPNTLDPRFLTYLLLTRDFISAVDGSTYGSKMPRANWEFIGNQPVAYPLLTEQRLIADFLDRETGKIDALIDEQHRMIERLNEMVASLALSSKTSSGTKEMRLENAARIIKRPVAQREDELYTPIGLFNRGRGLFHKDTREIDEMGDSDFFWIEESDLIISGQFAWEGAVALAGPEDAGCVVSHRYPVLRGKLGTSRTEYLFALLLTKHGDFLLNENSRGAAGRNRPLNINLLLKEKVPIPDMRTQEKVAQAVYWRNDLFSKMSKQEEVLKERRNALISSTVTGQINVRNYGPQEATAPCQ